MKKYINTSIIYALLAMVVGVFYREYTKFMNFQGVTILAKVHSHLFVLGMVFFLIIYLLSLGLNFKFIKIIDKFLIAYNVGLIITVLMMEIRGVGEVLQVNTSGTYMYMISGLAGFGHMILGSSIILVLLELRKLSK